MSRRRRLVGTVVVIVALGAPVVFDRDSFPLSVYPMYSRTRSSESTLVTAYSLDSKGRRSRLTPEIIGASDDPLVVAGELRNAIDRGLAAQRCTQIARRARDRSDSTMIEVVSERHDTVERTAGEPSLIERTVHAACEVGDT